MQPFTIFGEIGDFSAVRIVAKLEIFHAFGRGWFFLDRSPLLATIVRIEGAAMRFVLPFCLILAVGCGESEDRKAARLRDEKNRARGEVEALSNAAKQFFAEHGRWPGSIDDLPRDLPRIDPWGKLYRMSQGPGQALLELGEECPDVWTVHPNGEDIGNWIR